MCACVYVFEVGYRGIFADNHLIHYYFRRLQWNGENENKTKSASGRKGEGRRKAACMINAAVLSEQRLMEVPE